MPKYDVKVRRVFTLVEYEDLVIEAEDAPDAENKALEHDYGVEPHSKWPEHEENVSTFSSRRVEAICLID